MYCYFQVRCINFFLLLLTSNFGIKSLNLYTDKGQKQQIFNRLLLAHLNLRSEEQYSLLRVSIQFEMVLLI